MYIDGVNQYPCQCESRFSVINCETSIGIKTQHEGKAGFTIKLILADNKLGPMSKLRSSAKGF